MKLRTLAVAVAIAAASAAAHADKKFVVSGDIGVGYFKFGGTDGAIGESGSELNIDAEEKIGAVTYYGHLEIDVAGDSATTNFDGTSFIDNNQNGIQDFDESELVVIQGEANVPNLAIEELRVGAKGNFGDIRLGHLGDNGCGRVQKGGSHEVWITHVTGGCVNNASGGISYTRNLGKVEGSVSYRPGDEEASIGLATTFGPVSASIGYTDLDGDTNTAMGLVGKLGPVSAGFRYGKPDGGDAIHGINLLYKTASGINVYGGVETSDPDGRDRSMSIGFKKVLGQTDFILEASDSGASNDASSYGIGMRHRF